MNIDVIVAATQDSFDGEPNSRDFQGSSALRGVLVGAVRERRQLAVALIVDNLVTFVDDHFLVTGGTTWCWSRTDGIGQVETSGGSRRVGTEFHNQLVAARRESLRSCEATVRSIESGGWDGSLGSAWSPSGNG